MRKFLKVVKKVLIVMVLVGIFVCSYLMYDGYQLYKETIASMSLQEKVEEMRSDSSYLTYEEVPKLFVNAIVSVEDHRFYQHKGFDVISFTRAMLVNLKERSLVQGGSTITQQLAKNMYFSFEKKFTRKIAELLVAFDIEKEYSKEDIVTLYINSVYFGDGYYGLKEAANGYFQKEALELSEDEMTLLAGIPNAPSAYALSTHENLARKRQKTVVECLKKYGDKIE